MRNKLLLLAVLLFSSLLFLPAQAKKHHKKEDARGTVVTSVDTAKSMIVLTTSHNQQATTYNVALGTTLTLDGAPITLDRIRKGMHVVSYTSADAGTLSQLDVSKNPNAGK
jgi:hypothetical protein